MNKMLLFPIIVFAIVTLLGMLSLGYSPPTTSPDYISGGDITVDGETTSISFPLLSTLLFNPLTLVGTLLVLIGIVALLGTRAFSSGFSDTTQIILFKGAGYGGVYFMLSGLSYTLMDNIDIWGNVLFITLTLLFMLGFMQEVYGVRTTT